jgi:uncharacterized protein (DUF1800 family)
MLSVNTTAKLAKGLLLSSVISTAVLLTACGGGSGGSDSAAADNGQAGISNTSAIAAATVTSITDRPASRQEALRFLTQATFGPTQAETDRLMQIGYAAWFQEQAIAQTRASYVGYWDSRTAAIRAIKPGATAGAPEINHPFWKNAISGQDQLRQRMAFALSEIFVISTQDGCGANNSKSAAHYFDMLGQRAFGSYRDLLEQIALHPMMGCYLSHMRNQKEDPVTGRVPDENFAREILQLMSIGLHELNADGTEKLNASGQPIDTYGPTDITGLARVFTGWSLACPDKSDTCFKFSTTKAGALIPERWWMPMQPYSNFHSVSEKRFLGTVIPAQSVGDPTTSLKIALDTIAKHPNVAPFISKQLIQRFVTSNPSPAYVKRVADRFTGSNGNLYSTITAVLTDAEAKSLSALSNPLSGKVREPILRVSALLRAYGAQSKTGEFLLWSTADAGSGLAQNPLQSPSVFNFFRPGYKAPNSESEKSGLLAPELQIVHETSAAGYINYMKNVITRGIGAAGYDGKDTVPDVQLEYHLNTSSAIMNMAANPTALVEDINQRLMYGNMSSELKSEIISAISTVDYRDKKTPKADQIAVTYRYRLHAALLLTVASPEFQVQK